jgi:oligopeptide/dipeptide ABC transporter ATP-binding protein
MNEPLLSVTGLQVHYTVGSGRSRAIVRAVDGVDLFLATGELLALVGESGCGKTSVARAIAGLQLPDTGTLCYNGQDVAGLRGPARAAWRRGVQMVFQDPYDSLNPRKTVFATLAQPLRIHASVPKPERRAMAIRFLERVGLSPGADFLDRYPHQFSGGQRQRVCIARAIAAGPRLVVADEPVSSLDVSIRAQILKLFQELTREMRLACLFITHDLGVVRSLSNRVAIMYLGRIVEEGDTEAVFSRSLHPYTQALLAASPIPDPQAARRTARRPIEGDVPSPLDPPPGCHFHPRCRYRQEICAVLSPSLMQHDDGHRAACHFPGIADQPSGC